MDGPKWDYRLSGKLQFRVDNQLQLSDGTKNDIQQVMDCTNQYADSLDPLRDLPQSVSEFVRPEEAYSWLTS